MNLEKDAQMYRESDTYELIRYTHYNTISIIFLSHRATCLWSGLSACGGLEVAQQDHRADGAGEGEG